LHNAPIIAKATKKKEMKARGWWESRKVAALSQQFKVQPVLLSIITFIENWVKLGT